MGDEAYTAASPVDLDAERVSGWTFDRLVAELETAERQWSPPDNKAPGAVPSDADAKARERREAEETAAMKTSFVVAAAYAVAIGLTAVLLLWAYASMRRAEAAADALKRK